MTNRNEIAGRKAGPRFRAWSLPSISTLGAVLLVASLVPAPARAESRAEEDCTPLALCRRAEVVAVVRGLEPGAVVDPATSAGRVRVEEVLRGPAEEGTVLEIAAVLDREDARAQPGVRLLACLRSRQDGRWTAVSGALGLFGLADLPAGEDPTLTLFRVVAEEAGKAVPNRDRLRAALLRAAGDAHPRARGGAALDLLREPGILEGATDEERAALVADFRAASADGRAKFHLARVLGRLRPEGAAALLVDALVGEGGEALRPAVGEALADLGDPAAVALLGSRASDPSPEVRGRVAGALGWTRASAARGPLESLLPAKEPPVRREAAAGLGRLRVAGAAPVLLLRLVGEPGVRAPEGDASVRRALAWALAQCDAPDAWRALRTAATEDPDPAFRAFVAATLENPRRGFVR